jgi:hypothetical protein
MTTPRPLQDNVLAEPLALVRLSSPTTKTAFSIAPSSPSTPASAGARQAAHPPHLRLLSIARWTSVQTLLQVDARGGPAEGIGGEADVITTVAPVVGIALILVPVVARLGELLIRLCAQARMEKARQLAALNTILVMQPGSLVVVQHPDGTASLLVQAPTAAPPTWLEARW